MSCGEWTEGEFARRWSDHLRRRFASPAEIVEEFGVSFRTAEYWRAGETTPRGWQLARYLARNPEAVDQLFQDAGASARATPRSASPGSVGGGKP